jgi:hypothetical protein
MNDRKSNLPVWTIFLPALLGLLALLGVISPLPTLMKLISATLLALILPGFLAVRGLRLASSDCLEDLILSVGLSVGITTLITLTLLFSLGHLSLESVAGFFGLVLVILSILASRSPVRFGEQLNRRDLLYFVIPVGLASALSFSKLGYADYWGDEMNGLLRAILAIDGRWQIILEHTKGPVEILIPAVFGLLVGQFDPFVLRFPFALAFVAGIGAFFLLVRRLFNLEVALLAALFLAINGLHLAFGRIVQYQSVVLLASSLSILMAYQYFLSGKTNALMVSMLLVGLGLLAHYDMLLSLPPIAFLVAGRLGWRWSGWVAHWKGIGAAAVTLAIMIGIFYIPFLVHPRAAETSSYLTRRIAESGWISNNFGDLYLYSVMYNSRYYFLFVGILGFALIVFDLYRIVNCFRKSGLFWATIFGLVTVTAVIAVAGQLALLPTVLTLTILLILLRFSPASVELKTIYVWVGFSFIGFVFLVDDPRTHLRVIYPGWLVLAALALTGGFSAVRKRWDRFRKPWATAVASGGFILLLLLFSYYQYLLFVDTQREYIFTYPEHKNPFYWEDKNFPFGSRRLYGAPHRLGWQMILQLMVQGELNGDWHSNDDGTNLFWYTVGHERNPCYPRYYFLTEFKQKPAEEMPSSLQDPLNHGYVSLGKIYNHDRLQAEIFEFSPLSEANQPAIWLEPQNYATRLSLEDFVSRPYETPAATAVANSLTPSQIFAPTLEALQQIADVYGDPRITQVKDRAELVGYDLDTSWALPDGALLVTLHWQAAEVINLPYKVFVHLQDETGQLVAQSDDYPNCGTRPTNSWEVGKPVTDRHLLRLPEDLPPGQYTLKIGLYEPQTGLRLDLLDELGNPQGVSLQLTTVGLPVDQN